MPSMLLVLLLSMLPLRVLVFDVALVVTGCCDKARSAVIPTDFLYFNRSKKRGA